MSEYLSFESRVSSFWSKVNKDGPIPPNHPDMSNCWIWMGASSDGKYGQFSIGGLDRRQAHNVAFMLAHGRWPHVELDHLCHVTKCVRLEHLKEVGSRAENINNRLCSKICKRGHPLADPNLYYYKPDKNGRVRRRCKTCIPIAMAEWKARKEGVKA